MRVDTDSLAYQDFPVFLEKAEVLKGWLQGLSYQQLKQLWGCSETLARENAERLSTMELRTQATPALLAYDGIQYTYMAPTVFEQDQLAWVQEHLRILSGFYGVVRPMDGVVPYRLEMQAKATVAGCTNLYEFWGRSLYDEVMGADHVLLNLASKEYSRAIERFLEPANTYVTCVFGELEGGRVVQKGVYAKMARGEMVRYLASLDAQAPTQAKGFSWSGYAFDEARSTEEKYVFVRTAAHRAN